MKENDFMKLLNGMWFRCKYDNGRIRYLRHLGKDDTMVSRERLDNFKPLSELVTLASAFGAVTDVIVKNGNVIGGKFSIDDCCTVKCVLDDNGVLNCFAESSYLNGRIDIDLSDINNTEMFDLISFARIQVCA